MKKILIVDDDKIFAKVLRDALSTAHVGEYEITVANDGEEGLAKIEELSPDLVVLDMMLPKIGGLDILRDVHEKNPDLPILMSTQIADLDKISEAVQGGAKGYIVKSDYSLEHIIRQVDEILK